MSNHYPFKEIENKWQKSWEEQGTYAAEQPPADDRPKYYGLVEFPYPSGDGLHVGHPRSYTAIDIVTRKQRMQGKNVLYPMGWDAFGLPAENFAIKTKQQPAVVTAKNIANFKRQIQMLGVGFDWNREINTTDPAYYKWTQWMFIQFFEAWFDEKLQKARPISELDIPQDVEARGPEAVREYRDARRLAFKHKTEINWCPKCKIGLANEEAAGGVCDRCGGPVEKREKEQWMLRITKYAQRLIDELDEVDYLEKIKTSQINWIGRSEGALIQFKITNHELRDQDRVMRDAGRATQDVIEVFTTRPDTLFGATYLVLSPEHPLIKNYELRIKNFGQVKKYQEQAKKKSDLERQENKDKTGVQLEGLMAVNPATGKEIPVWVADYVLSGYGTGAIMAVPAHDERDFEFAKKFDLPVTYVVAPSHVDHKNPPQSGKKTVKRNTIHALIYNPKNKKVLCLKWKNYDWTTFIVGGVEEGEDEIQAALREIEEETGYTDVKFVRRYGGPIQASYFAAHKDENRLAMAHGLVFELQSEKKIEVSPEEQEKHEVVWLERSEITPDRMNCSELEYWLQALDGKEVCFAGDGIAVNSGFLDGLETAKATDKMIEWLEKQGAGERKINYKLRDWVFSRQRYWGEPMPMTYCEMCGWAPVNESDLPLLLPEVKNYEPTDTGESPLSAIKDWVAVECAICGGPAKRETDTMPNWAGSSWYFLRYCDPRNEQEFASSFALKYWMPVDLYNGGMEHTTLHLLYSRFWYKVLFDLGHVPSACGHEPYKARRSHAMILGEGGVKMSKSKGNVVNPDDMVEKYGADVFRTYEMFIGPYDADAPWSDRDIQGVKRFLDKVWNLVQSRIKNYELRSEGEVPTLSASGLDAEDVQSYDYVLNYTIKKVGEDIDNLRFNTAVSQLMILTNELQGLDMRSRDVRSYVKLIAPFAPHMAEELWQALGHEKSVHVEAWPEYDDTKLVRSKVVIAVQVNGKLRAEINVPLDAEQDVVSALALEQEPVKKHLADKPPKKVIYVKNKIINYVV